ncbi:hypothetical protein J19TS2_33280 [Cohnella xylanilytica]|uniref:Uncharacterized protein n=1 Tax=Cohnella xylanilytica TaxID=557555 RepID=A0A841UAG5_9BACL|nr:hypothetical protein [Cohnella xylanilytica]MBB6694961.1 hypothetical protein [Cohnella xylanilytica]GIO13773.1 hypothetical protein J19TS2_33280 [Cohnella xylanilytica]
MNSSFVRNWERKRALGKKNYVMRYGLLLIGMGCVVLFSVLELANNGEIHYPYLLGRLLIFPTLGAMISGMRWEGNERKYAKLTGRSS